MKTTVSSILHIISHFVCDTKIERAKKNKVNWGSCNEVIITYPASLWKGGADRPGWRPTVRGAEGARFPGARRAGSGPRGRPLPPTLDLLGRARELPAGEGSTRLRCRATDGWPVADLPLRTPCRVQIAGGPHGAWRAHPRRARPGPQLRPASLCRLRAARLPPLRRRRRRSQHGSAGAGTRLRGRRTTWRAEAPGGGAGWSRA